MLAFEKTALDLNDIEYVNTIDLKVVFQLDVCIVSRA